MARFDIRPILLLALVLAGCDGAADPAATQPGAFPSCPAAPEATGEALPEGLRAPPGSVMTSVRPSGKKLLIVKGHVAADPIAIEKHYRELRRDRRFEFFLLEHEVIEAEAFFTDGQWRNYVTARTVCEGRSELHIIVAPEDYGEEVKLPEGQLHRVPRAG